MKQLLFILICFLSVTTNAQDSLSRLLSRYNNNKTPYILVEELANSKANYYILDAREQEEYNVSHLKDAFYVGYKNFKLKNIIENISNKNDTIVVYCSLGVRSEKIANQLKNAGYSVVYNLYGGIFEWKNADLPVYNLKNKETDSIHAFSKTWDKWLTKGIKVYN
ncbi:rhodanese-like domain-containing protein [Bizionia sp. KMM 8389]